MMHKGWGFSRSVTLVSHSGADFSQSWSPLECSKGRDSDGIAYGRFWGEGWGQIVNEVVCRIIQSGGIPGGLSATAAALKASEEMMDSYRLGH